MLARERSAVDFGRARSSVRLKRHWTPPGPAERLTEAQAPAKLRGALAKAPSPAGVRACWDGAPAQIMRGWLLVDARGHAEDEGLRRWIDRGLAYASSLPPK
jgi:hypothetical protein